MKISELQDCPEWLAHAKTKDADVAIRPARSVIWGSGQFLGGRFLGGEFLDGEFRDGEFLGGNFLGGTFMGGQFLGGQFRGGQFRGGIVAGRIAQDLRAWTGLYRYQVMAFVSDGVAYVKMGCLVRTLEEWDRIGIRNSNLGEFPDDGSDESEERVRAFEFARAAALDMLRRV